jgi:hypothetical protein
MRKIKQISTQKNKIFVLTEDGFIWSREFGFVKEPPEYGWLEWEFIEGPPEGDPPKKPIPLEEIAEHLNEKGGKRIFIGKGHHLAGKQK